MGKSQGTNYTRRSHIVRIKDKTGGTGTGASGGSNYVDIEVLDAVAFRVANDKEVILNFAAKPPVPFIVDNTGDGNGKQTAKPTRQSHMKRITSKDGKNFFDIEVLDFIAFRDTNGGEWILALPDDKSSVYNSTTGAGDVSSTRRVHNEKISKDLTKSNPTSYLTMVRNDYIAFRSTNGEEVILAMPSNNDPLSSDKAAVTFTTPQGYDPTVKNPTVVPPDNKDPNVYFAFVKGSGGITTGDVPVEMGPLWWIRNIAQSGQWVLLSINARSFSSTTAPPPLPTVTFDFGTATPSLPIAELLDQSETTGTSSSGSSSTEIVYFVWNNIAPFPTTDNFANIVFNNPPFLATYLTQFSQVVLINDGGAEEPRPNLGLPPGFNSGGYAGNGMFNTLAEAQAYADQFATDYAIGPAHQITGYFGADGVQVRASGVPATLFAASLVTSSSGSGSATAILNGAYLIKVPDTDTTFKVAVSTNGSTPGTSLVVANGYSDQPTPLKTVNDANAATADAPNDPPDVLSANGTSITTSNYTVETKLVPAPDPHVQADHVQIIVTLVPPPSGGGGGAR